MSKIFDDSDSDTQIKTDNEYAKNYDKWRKKEELNRLKTKYGDDLLDDESSSSSSDDEEGVELTDEVEKQFFKTLSCLKNKDPRIYDENVRFFDETPINRGRAPKKGHKDKPLFINDYERELILKKNGEISDDETGEAPPDSPTYVEEQNKLKESFKEALDRVSEEDWGGVLKIRKKTEEEKKREEADYLEWLAGQKEEIEDKEITSELEPLKKYWNKPDLDEDEKFLRDYILQKKFLSHEDEDYIPTYEEIVHDSDKDLSEDEDAIERQEEFEHKYNFRFEEPDQEFIKRYPRTMEHSLRKTDDKRKLKRQETKERKKKEKEQKMQEMKKLQELKRKEIEEKIEKLKEITGNKDMEFKDEDLESDFDPEAHDKRMQNLFNDDFYQAPEDDQKPEFPELDEFLEIENWEKWNGEEENEPHCEDEDFNMDCDYETTKQELIENSKGRKKRKRKSLFAKAVKQPKPVFDPNDKTYEQYLDEYYKFDCEDIIGDVPCRFKYRKVVPNNFGLSIEEILTANDRELNRWCSLKKAIQIRPDHVEKYDQIAFEKKGRNVELKKKILPSLFINEKEKEKNDESDNKKKKKMKKVRCVKTNEDVNKKKRKLAKIESTVPNKRAKKGFKEQEVGITDARLSAYGINPKKFKNKLKYKKN
ncbi:protein KRI1 homolog isoform X2 [Tribolium madens]|uniref:protein KRI1 homolog isoform X2 n=1 Tax=Tribolium madens TaxID=41895 RepID=UPI001CF7481B|nr:protein KRI1 homolog isoform X2 [Tribolium madens]